MRWRPGRDVKSLHGVRINWFFFFFQNRSCPGSQTASPKHYHRKLVLLQSITELRKQDTRRAMVEIKGGTRGGRLCTLAPEKIKFASPVVRLRWSKLELWIPRGSAPGPPPPPPETRSWIRPWALLFLMHASHVSCRVDPRHTP